MPKQHARGNIIGYLIAVNLKNGSVSTINGSVYTSAETCAQCGQDIIMKETSELVSHAQQSYLPCAQEQSCIYYLHLSIAVQDVKAIKVTANTVMGESSPAFVALPKPSKSFK